MKLSIRIAAAGLALTGALLACDDNPFIAGVFAVDGRWTGSALAGSGEDTVRFHFDLTLEQDRNDVTGSGEVRTTTATFPVEVDGRWDYPSVDLVLRSESTAPLTFTATFDQDTLPTEPPTVTPLQSDTLVGTLHGSGLEGLRLEIGRTSN